MYHNVNEKGYGFIPRMVMQDRRLSIQAKAIYAYYCSFNGGGTTFLPPQSKVMADLGIDEASYVEHFNYLIRYKYITISQEKTTVNSVRNIFTIEKQILF